MPADEQVSSGKILSGSMWMLGMRWGMRVIGLVSTIIIARILQPDDFGVIAIALIVVHFFEYLSFIGVDLALINDQRAEREKYDAAWTLNLCIGLFLAVLILISAPFAADFFNDPRVEPVIQVLSLKAVLSGLENIGVVNFRKELEFRKDFLFNIYKKTISFVVLISLVFYFRDYWGIVWAFVISQSLEVAFSYYFHPYRPRFSFAAIGSVFSFSKWVWISNMANFCRTRIDELAVGRMTSTASLGDYHIASYVATAPGEEIALPLSRALMPVYSRMQDDLASLARSYLFVLGILCQLLFPLCLGLTLVADDFVAVILGDNWRQITPIVEILALSSLFTALTINSGTVFTGIGRPKLNAIVMGGQIILLIPAIIILGMQFGLEGIAAARTATAMLTLLVFFALLNVFLPVSAFSWFHVMLRPFLATAAMTAALFYMERWATDIPAADLFLQVVGGAAVYVAVSAPLWFLQGRPDGVEKILHDRWRARRAAAAP